MFAPSKAPTSHCSYISLPFCWLQYPHHNVQCYHPSLLISKPADRQRSHSHHALRYATSPSEATGRLLRRYLGKNAVRMDGWPLIRCLGRS
jgi:hypothetical protein